MGTILQWNCRGLMNNHPELCLLAQQYNPVVMCLQATHIADISKFSFKGYTPYHRLDNSHHCAKNQVSIPRKPIGNQQETPGLHAVST